MVNLTDKYILFFGGTFDNFCPCVIIYNDIEFHSSEQLFMYLKALTFDDLEVAELISKVSLPVEAKRLGRHVRNFDEEIWIKERERCMETAVYEKFKQNETLRKELLCEEFKGLQFVEASPFDTNWGIGLSTHNPDAYNKETWKGLNLLGQCIDRVRDRLLVECK
ncbi:MAG: NADAR family protein [Rikenellaceae bacterium]